MTATILAAKKHAGLTWEALAERVGGHEAWLVSACFGENSMPEQAAERLCSVLSLPAGPHILALQWRVTNSQAAQCRPASQPGREHATVTFLETLV